MNIDGNKINQPVKGNPDQNLILVYDSLRIHLQNLHVHDGANKGILMQTGVTESTIINCIVNDNFAEGIFIDTSTKLTQFCTVTSCIVRNNGLAGIAATGIRHIISNNIVKQNGADGIFISGREIVVSNNVVDNNADCGIGGDNSWITPFRGNAITGNTVLNNKRNGISLLNAEKTAITGNVVHSNGYGKEGERYRNGIMLEGNSYTNEITGNVCYNEVNNPTPNQMYGVRTFDSSDRNLVVGNVLRDNGVGPYCLVGSNNLIANNIK